MIWRSIKSICMLLAAICLQYSHALTTPLGEINNASTVRQPGGTRAAEVTFTHGTTNQQALQINVQPTQGQAQTIHVPFHLLNQIQNANLQGVGMLLPHIPAALATLTLTQNQNIPQFNQHMSVQHIIAIQGVIYLTLGVLSQNGQWVSIQITLSLNAPGEVLVSLPTGFLLPTHFVINMLPQQPDIPVSPPNMMEILNMLNAVQLQVFQEVNPYTGQMESLTGF
ncbi:hypothetical protein [Endozoicomonas arenosclerae]|uniref:hypothetical protein n=1 Tax=Endozoicomonas arenosclerae TaxID=1633495 RepID=UPI0007842F77|nr:hypothetical protein [Endozoicomonas arenosclerae]